jgi:hypothetical protein
MGCRWHRHSSRCATWKWLTVEQNHADIGNAPSVDAQRRTQLLRHLV